MHKKIALVAVGVLLAVSPLFASAQSITLPTVPANASVSQLEALIVELTGLLNTLLAQQSSGQSSTQPLATINQSSLTTTSGASLIATVPTPTPYSIVAGGTTGVTVGSFTLQPSGDNVQIQRIGFDLAAQSAYSGDVTSASIWDGATQVGTVTFNGSATSDCPPNLTDSLGSCSLATSTVSSLTLPQNVQTNFTIKANIAPIGIGQSGNPGDDIVIGLADAQGVGASSGAIVNSGPAAEPTGTGVRIFKSYPTVSQLSDNSSLTGSVGKQSVLIRFSITASASGPVGIQNIAFAVNASGATFSVLNGYVFTDSAFSQPAITALGDGALYAPMAGSGTGSFTADMHNGNTPLEIPAGETYYFELTGSPSSVSANASVQTTLNGDSSYQYGTSGIAVDSNFDWSPNDNGISQEPGSDWTDGYGVTGLPATGLTQTITGTGSPVVVTTCATGYMLQGNSCVATNTSAAPTCTLTASPASLQSGQATTLAWTSSNATGAAWIPDPSGKDSTPPNGTPNTSGSMSFIPPTILVGSGNPSEFLKVTGPGGSETCSVNLSVTGPEQAAFSNNVFTQGSTPTPTISGTASGVSTVTVLLYKGTPPNAPVAYNASAIPVTNGHWSITVSPALATGSYFVYVDDSVGNALVNGGYLNVVNTSTAVVTTCAAGQTLQNGSCITTNTLSATCQGNPYNSGTPGVAWSSTPSGGTGSYTYQWTLSNDVIGTGINGNSTDLLSQNLLATYASTGAKSASVTIKSGGQSATAACSATGAAPVSTQTNPVVISSFLASPGAVVSGQSTTFSWSSDLTKNDITQNGGGCYISPSTNLGNELNINSNYGPTGTFTYTPTATATYTLTCRSGGKDGSPSATQQFTITVVPSTGSQTPTGAPMGSIDQSSLNAASASNVMLTGSAAGIGNVYINITGNGLSLQQFLPVTNNRWTSQNFTGLAPNSSYTVTLYPYSSGLVGQALASGTLQVSGPPPTTITVAASGYVQNGSQNITATWANPSGAKVNDWIALVPTGTSWSSSQATSGVWVWAVSGTKTQGGSGSTSGSVAFGTAEAPGQYQLVYYNDQQNSSGAYGEEARSATFTITSASSSAISSDQLANLASALTAIEALLQKLQ